MKFFYHSQMHLLSIWSVTLKNVGRLRKSTYIKLFDKSECDILAVFIEPENRVILLETKDIDSKHSIAIKKES